LGSSTSPPEGGEAFAPLQPTLTSSRRGSLDRCGRSNHDRTSRLAVSGESKFGGALSFAGRNRLSWTVACGWNLWVESYRVLPSPQKAVVARNRRAQCAPAAKSISGDVSRAWLVNRGVHGNARTHRARQINAADITTF